MRTVFDIVLGILFTVAKACLHALATTAGVLAFCGILAAAAVYAWRRSGRRATLVPASNPVDETKVISIED
jgi:hypothetical protein